LELRLQQRRAPHLSCVSGPRLRLRNEAAANGSTVRWESGAGKRKRRLMRRLDCLPHRELVIELRRALTALSLGGYKSALPT